MTQDRSFKRLVRRRMEKTGESYTAARRMLLAGEETEAPAARLLATSDKAIRERTGRGWEQWFSLLDEWGADQLTHTEIARRVAAELALDPLAWNTQAITVSYERARSMRAVGERSDGFAASASKTVAVPVERLSMRSPTRGSARGGCPTAVCASARRRGRRRPASTGATALKAQLEEGGGDA